MDRFSCLFNRYISKRATLGERSEFQDMLQKREYDAQLKDLIEQYLLNSSFDKESPQLGSGKEILEAVFAVDKERDIAAKGVVRRLWSYRLRSVVAVAVAVVLFGLGLFYLSRNFKSAEDQALVSASKLMPGTHSATLTLANGKRIKLSDVESGKLAEEAGVSISKTADGQITYVISSERSEEKSQAKVTDFNTLSTAKGETYQLRLPDGTLVWLNAVSSIKYPANFVLLKERRIELQGEAYFEVASHYRPKGGKGKIPFIVTTGIQEVEVLGTHFNVSAYNGEATIKTTLLEGAVKVVPNTGNAKVIAPGQQALLGKTGLEVKEVEVEDVIAWKKGFFTFDNESMESIMTKLERWYNVKVVYGDDAVKAIPLYGSFSKFENFATVVKILERTKLVKIEVKGNIIRVSSKK